jgi:hypothetical protein
MVLGVWQNHQKSYLMPTHSTPNVLPTLSITYIFIALAKEFAKPVV